MSRYVFGIDGGGTRSRIRLADENGCLRFRAEGGSTNMYSVGVETALQNLKALIENAFEAAELDKATFAAGCIGSAGLDRPGERQAYQAFFQALLGEHCPVKLCNDGEILLVGGLREMEGYCLIGGTGSLALARRKDGQMARAGGLGYMLGDEGSACWIGWAAVRRTLRSRESRDLPTAMMDKLLSHFELHSPSDFVACLHQRFDKVQVADAASIVTEAACDHDPLAMDICQKAAAELALLVESVVQAMPLPCKRLAMSGGVLEHSQLIRKELTALLSVSLPELVICKDIGTAEEGAVMLAERHAREAADSV